MNICFKYITTRGLAVVGNFRAHSNLATAKYFDNFDEDWNFIGDFNNFVVFEMKD